MILTTPNAAALRRFRDIEPGTLISVSAQGSAWYGVAIETDGGRAIFNLGGENLSGMFMLQHDRESEFVALSIIHPKFHLRAPPGDPPGGPSYFDLMTISQRGLGLVVRNHADKAGVVHFVLTFSDWTARHVQIFNDHRFVRSWSMSTEDGYLLRQFPVPA